MAAREYTFGHTKGPRLRDTRKVVETGLQETLEVDFVLEPHNAHSLPLQRRGRGPARQVGNLFFEPFLGRFDKVGRCVQRFVGKRAFERPEHGRVDDTSSMILK